jgi:hypothetical protein
VHAVQQDDAFDDLLAQLADGARWKVLSGKGRAEFTERLTSEIVELEPRRRQAVLMCLFALLAMNLQPDELAQYLDGRDMSRDDEVEALITWLRENYDPGS